MQVSSNEVIENCLYDGCPVIQIDSELKVHKQTCGYRIKLDCHVECGVEDVPMCEYLLHLATVRKVPMFEERKATVFVQKTGPTYFNDENAFELRINFFVVMSDCVKHLTQRHKYYLRSSARRWLSILEDDKLLAEGSWPVEILEKEEKIFLLHNEIRGDDTVYFWMTVLGGLEIAAEYIFELKLFKKMDDGQDQIEVWKMPVVAFHAQTVSRRGFSCYVVIPPSILLKICTPVEPVEKIKFWFDVSFRICRQIV
ncbi:hypothetical protein Fcan01_19636 [Folsomia candida]|uniref:Uncharacterized protein n=1 Tax=Folsomia candida TaxID=158441 RepID=A0A226DL98_FOLCA|nr:hypothetical protein Fcan01_19642 [Folsomia candida]OXA45768.1 hypothetical protein Fcan01_19636 [Folsomia candida]